MSYAVAPFEVKSCERCRERDRIIETMRQELSRLSAENARLTRAIQRESHVWDERVIRNK